MGLKVRPKNFGLVPLPAVRFDTTFCFDYRETQVVAPHNQGKASAKGFIDEIIFYWLVKIIGNGARHEQGGKMFS